MISGNVDGNLATCEVEHTLLWLGGKELHVVGRSDLAKNVGVIQDFLIQNVGVLPCPLLITSVMVVAGTVCVKTYRLVCGTAKPELSSRVSQVV